MRILFVTQIVPYPPHGGVLQRGFNLLRMIGQRHHVQLLAFHHPDELSNRDAVNQSIAELGKFCESVEYFPLWPKLSRAHKLAAFAVAAVYPKPFSVLAHRNEALSKRIAALCSGPNPPDVVHLDTIALAPYARYCGRVPVVLGHHNVESQLMARRAGYENNIVTRWYVRRQARSLERYERESISSFPLNICVSEDDARCIREMSLSANIAVVPNGVDTEYFKPLPGPESPSVIYTGGMNMFANRDAVEWFLDSIWPAVKTQVPSAQFYAIGQRPSPRVLAAAAADPSVHAPGFVDDVRPWVAKCAVFAIPLRVGGGTKLKMMDAMAQGKAIVSTAVGAEGIDIEAEKHFLLAHGAEEFTAKVVELLNNETKRRNLAAAARQRAETRYAWPILAEELIRHYSGVTRKSQQ